MQTQNKEQILLRIDSGTASLIRQKAKRTKTSVNRYFLALAVKDLQESPVFPKVRLPERLHEDILSLAGDGTRKPTREELENDARLAAVWNQ